jgi:hypothetical protein
MLLVLRIGDQCTFLSEEKSEKIIQELPDFISVNSSAK